MDQVMNMRTAIMWLLALVLGCLLANAPARADQVTLKNGDRLTGTILEYDGTQVRMKTELAGTVRISWEAITALTTEQPLAVTLAEHGVVRGRIRSREGRFLIEQEGEELAVERNTVEALRTPEAQAAYERRLRPGLLELWEGSVDAGLSATRGNSDTITLALGFKGERETLADKLIARFDSLFARDSTGDPSNTTANTFRGGLRYERAIHEKFFTFGFTDLEFDELQQLDLRWVLGGGLGWRARKTSRTSLEVFSGASFNQEFFEAAPTRRSGELLVGEELSYKLTSRTSLKQRLTFSPNLNQTGEYRISLDSSAETKLSRQFNWLVTLSDRFLSNPPPGVQRNDLLLTTGIRWSFGETVR